MAINNDLQQELDFLSDRVRQLSALQESQKHLSFVVTHLQDHIDKLRARIRDIEGYRLAS